MSRKALLILVNIEIIISTIIITILGVTGGAGGGQVGDGLIGVGYFKPFTIDSNILMAIMSLILLCNLNKKKNSKNIITLYLIGATATGLTFFTVLLFLIPSFIVRGDNYLLLLSDDMFFFHVLNPILAMISVIFLLDGKKIKIKQRFATILPTFIYAIVYMIHVIFIEDWNDFYNFTFGRKDYLVPFVCVVMCLVTFGIASLLAWGYNKNYRRKTNFICK